MKEACRVTSSPPERPLLLYDGGCGFCRLWIERWRATSAGRVEFEASQEAGVRFPEIPADLYARSVVLIEPDGAVWSGAQAVLRALAAGGRRRWPLWCYDHVPGAAPLAESVYRAVASHRVVFSRATRLLWGSHVTRSTFFLSRCLFVRTMAIVYLVALVSLWVQIDGLVGSRGILPVAPYLETLSQRLGPARYWLAPTLCWIDSSDAFLHLLCGGGTLLCLLLLLGLAPAPCLAILWTIYLSLTTVCRGFLGFQWDNLLLESGLLAIFAAPARLRCRLPCPAPPSRLATGLVGWLVFRLMLSSGLVKLTSGDATWRRLTALDFHYETQPLPAWTSWYAHHMPGWFHSLSVAVMFAIELGAPFCLLAPRRVRHAGLAALVLLQILIALTGNYGFFNVLSIALCLALVDDAAWPRRWRERLARAREGAGAARERRWLRIAALPAAGVIVLLGLVHLVGALRVDAAWPAPVEALVSAASPFRSVNGYGLFMVMTTRRPEIVIEGSRDGVTWLPYEPRWKPSDPLRAPAFVAPHMPRLDWLLWFAALSDYQSNPWFTQLMARLLEGSPPVLDLFAGNPFPEEPPRYVRAQLYDYHFTDAATRRKDGAWWSRELRGIYAPPLSLRRPSHPQEKP